VSARARVFGAAERASMITAICDVFLDQGQGVPDIWQPTFDSLMVEQDFEVMYWMEKNPNLVVPGNPATKYNGG